MVALNYKSINSRIIFRIRNSLYINVVEEGEEEEEQLK
jgi:hypothetical protein